MTRINKYLASCGVSSRRTAESFILAGRVNINGTVTTDLSAKVTETDVVELDGKVLSCQPNLIYIIMNKPAGVVTTCSDQFNRKTVLDLLGDIETRVYPVGRLDYATEGLLLLTNDGEFARRLTHPSSQIPKTYIVRTDKPITKSDLQKLRNGVVIDGQITHPAKARYVKESPAQNIIELTITEGRNRQVRKMFEAIGARVLKLKRTSIGTLTLGDLKTGEWCITPKPNL